MVLCSVHKFRDICRSISIKNIDATSRLQVPAISSSSQDGFMGGFGALLLALVKEENLNLLGTSSETEAIVRQWIEYSICKVNNMESCGLTREVFKDINGSLAGQTFLAGNFKTIADIVFYHLLYDSMCKLSFQEKEQYIHLSRWYNNLQQDANLRGSHSLLTFSRTPLY